MKQIKKPEVQLSGEDGNAHFIVGRCHRAWNKAGLPEAEWEEIRKEMMSGNYDHLLQTAMKYFDVN